MKCNTSLFLNAVCLHVQSWEATEGKISFDMFSETQHQLVLMSSEPPSPIRIGNGGQKNLWYVCWSTTWACFYIQYASKSNPERQLRAKDALKCLEKCNMSLFLYPVCLQVQSREVTGGERCLEMSGEVQHGLVFISSLPPSPILRGNYGKKMLWNVWWSAT